jgi:predicted ATPase/class 3 adenylate cyclase
MMGADLAERLRRAGIEASGQRRNVTILFADLTGYTSLSERMDSEEIFELIQRYIHLLVNCVYKYEGIVDKLTGDGLMALFGAPIMHENNAERACLAALDMQKDVSQLSHELFPQLGQDLRMHIGLNSGEVVVGGIGSNLLMNYTAIGDTVNLAHRLEEAAQPGTTLVSESVYRQTRALFDYQVFPGLQLKGISKAINGYRILGAKAAPGRVRGIEGLHAPMIGREKELNQLKLALNDLYNHERGQFGLITGEAGLGKSRLTTEFRKSLDPAGIQVLEGQSMAHRHAISYGVFQDVLFHLLNITPGTPVETTRQRLHESVTALMGRRAAAILPLLENLLSLPFSDPASADRIAFLEAGQLRKQTFLAVRSLLISAARQQPVLLILEDLHWADEASLELLRFLLEALRLAPIFILGISRHIQAGPLDQAVEWAQHNLGTNFCLIPLHSLSPDQTEVLLFELMAIRDLPQSLRSQILQRSAGIPLYLEETLRMLLDQGAIQREDGHWRITPGTNLEDLGVPDTVQGLVLARFDRLGSLHRHTLQVAAVIGKDFSLPVLNQVLQQPLPESVLDTLVEREFLIPPASPIAQNYIFRHILMVDAIYSTLLKRDRLKMHQQVAEAIETIYQYRLDEQVEILARHFSASSRLDRALHYLILAGQKAALGYANSQARQHFEEALQLLSQVKHSPRQELQVHMGLGDILVLAGEYPQARQHFLQALELIGNQEPADYIPERSALRRKVGITFERQGEYEQAIEDLSIAQDILIELHKAAPEENALILNDIGWIQFRRGNLDEAQESFIEALSQLENTPRFDVLASIYNRLGGVYYQKDQLNQASEYVRKSLELRQEAGDTVAVARSYNNLGLLNWKQGDWDTARENFNRSMELHLNLGDVEGTIEVQINLGLLQLDSGNVPEATLQLQKAAATAGQIGHTYHVGLAYLYLARVSILVENWQDALDFGNRSLQILEEIGAQDDLVIANTYLGMAYLGLGDLEQAILVSDKAYKLCFQSEAGPAAPDENRGWVLRLLGEVALAQQDYPRSEELLQQSIKVFETIHNPLELGRSYVSLARLAHASQNYEQVQKFLWQAREIFNQLGAGLETDKLQALSTGLLK